MTSIRAGRGLGDGIYLQSVVRHLLLAHEALEVCTDWPDLFQPFGDRVRISPFRRDDVHLVAHYTERKRISGTDQFRDCCLSVGIDRPIEFRLDFVPEQYPLASDKPIVLVGMMREPFARKDGFGLDLLPRGERLQEIVDRLKGRATLVEVGQGKSLFEFDGIDIDLRGKTTVRQLLNLAAIARGFVGYCSFMVPLAEALSKPGLYVWSRRGQRSANDYIRTITPAKIFHRAYSRHVVDDCSSADIAKAADALCSAIGGR